VFDFRADFCHSAPFETHAFDLMFRANALEGQKRFPISRPTIEVATASICITAETKSRTAGLAVQPIRNSGNFSRGMGGKNGHTLEYAANNDLQYRSELLKHCKLSSPLVTMSIGPRGCAIVLKSSLSASKLGFLRREHVRLADS
jgi:hypothetical protein